MTNSVKLNLSNIQVLDTIQVLKMLSFATIQAKGKERQWLKHQTHGDLDEAKLIEGLTGERAIYKRSGEKEPEVENHP